MQLGVPYDVAMRLDDAERLAHLVALRELGNGMTKGGVWDWDAMALVAVDG